VENVVSISQTSHSLLHQQSAAYDWERSKTLLKGKKVVVIGGSSGIGLVPGSGPKERVVATAFMGTDLWRTKPREDIEADTLLFSDQSSGGRTHLFLMVSIPTRQARSCR